MLKATLHHLIHARVAVLLFDRHERFRVPAHAKHTTTALQPRLHQADMHNCHVKCCNGQLQECRPWVQLAGCNNAQVDKQTLKTNLFRTSCNNKAWSCNKCKNHPLDKWLCWIAVHSMHCVNPTKFCLKACLVGMSELCHT